MAGESNLQAVTPNGTVIEYEPKPKRLYRVDGLEVPSVTQILDCLDKPALPWWGMKIGVQGVLSLLCDHREVLPNDLDAVISMLTQHELTVNHQRDKAGDRGVNVHDALENWAKTGWKPDPALYPQDEVGYVEGLVAFLDTVDLEPVDIEVMVGSKEHGYAGRYDLRAMVQRPAEVPVKNYPKRASKMTTIPAGRFIFDLKTSKGIFESHHLQLAAYEAAGVECGYEPTDAQVILHVTADGRFEVRRNRATIEDFLGVKAAYDALARVKAAA